MPPVRILVTLPIPLCATSVFFKDGNMLRIGGVSWTDTARNPLLLRVGGVISKLKCSRKIIGRRRRKRKEENNIKKKNSANNKDKLKY